MDLFPRAIPPKEEQQLKKFVNLRIIMSTLVIGAAIMVMQFQARMTLAAGLYSLLGIVYLSTGFAYLAFRKGISPGVVILLLVGIDMVVFTMLIHYSGGSASYFTILFILPILVGGQFFQVAGGLITAIFATSVYFTYSMLEISGRIYSPPGTWMGTYSNSIFSNLMIQGYLFMVIFILTGLISGYVSKYLQSKGRELADKEREIRRIKLDTDSILINMSSGLIVTDLQGRILSINTSAVEILGVDTDKDYKGINCRKAFSHMPALVDELEFVPGSNTQKKRYEIEVCRTDGVRLPLGISISILKDENDEIKGVIAIFQDLTEVRRMREKIRQSDRLAAVGELSAAIAHEVRAPLASICGSIEMLKGELELSGDNEKLMDLIIRESDRLDRIITDFLEFAKLRKPSFSHADIAKSVEDIALLLKYTPNLSHKMSIDINVDIDDSRLYIDNEQIMQVFLNIGLNACEMMKGHGTLSVCVTRVQVRLRENEASEECIQIDFHNDGPVIPEDVLPNIFEPFFTTKQAGTGLGLATAARIIESHSGIIKVKSSKEAGTVFSVILPVHASRMEEEEKTDNVKEFCNV